ncbi:MAG: YdcF family protein [Lachnospiraceae bacterium]|nr:YdcF family protein [Lachnospiraceae bacterium]
MIKFIKKYIFLVLALIIAIYLFMCDVLMTFSISMNVVFLTAVILLLMIQYMVNVPLNKKVRGPSFVRILIIVASIFFFSGIFSILAFNLMYPKHSINTNNQEYDYIIVFGAGVKENKNEIMNSRIDKAIEYSKIYKRCKFVLTGARGANEPIEEAIYMKNYMTDRGMDERRLIIDTYSYNTYQNVYNSLNLIKKDVLIRNKKERIITRPFKSTDKEYFDLDFLNIGFMSSEFHLTRINMMAKKVGIYRPYDISCNTRNLYKPYMYIREDLSLFKAFVLNQLKL